MLQQFSWPQFLLAVGLLSLIWYVVVVLVFYRKELKRLLGLDGGGSGLIGAAASTGAEPLPHRWKDGVQEWPASAAADTGISGAEAEGLMGKSRLPQGMSSLSMEELSFGSVDAGEAESDQEGLVPDVLQDVKEVFEILAREDGTKRDFFRLMETVRLSYPGLSAHPALRRINAFISGHASFQLSAEELEDLWN